MAEMQMSYHFPSVLARNLLAADSADRASVLVHDSVGVFGKSEMFPDWRQGLFGWREKLGEVFSQHQFWPSVWNLIKKQTIKLAS